MGASASKSPSGKQAAGALLGPQLAVTAGDEAQAKERDAARTPKVPDSERAPLQATLVEKIAIFANLTEQEQQTILDSVYVRTVPEGDLLIVEGGDAAHADEMYVVATGEFEVLQKVKGVNIKVNSKGPGDVFGEVALFMNTKRTATVAAVTRSTVYVVERAAFRKNLKNAAQEQTGQIELFLNSVPILKHLTREERLKLVRVLKPRMKTS